ncbi:MAG: MBL fold metallo-hydrolase [Candidatus Promineifilaceae bacterium]|nr:MBL fold metallo-hydrolase [Candidatus Promineifilaceae bacterium]
MDVHTLDLSFQGLPESIAAYLIEAPAGVLLIETGPMTTLETLKVRLAEHGLSPEDVGDVLVTHIHLDHAGAAGWWARQGARVYVHHVGAPHLVDPDKLWQSASRIYGDLMETLWGEILPAPAGQVTSLHDGDTVEVAGLTLTALDTPGHAWHHHTYLLGNVAFTGDAAGVRVPASQWVSLPAPPPEFDVEAWEQTLDRIKAEQFDSLYLTHFGRVTDVDNQLQQLRTIMKAATAFVRREMEAGTERDELVRRYIEWNREQAQAAGMSPSAFDQYEAANPLYMSVDGIMRYWRKREEAAAQ